MKSTFLYCSVSIAPIRSIPSDSSEMITQLIFGEIVELLEEDKQWRKVKSYLDQYEGWVDEKLLSPLSDKEMKRWMDEQILLYNPHLKLDSDSGEITLTKGAFIVDIQVGDQFNIGKNIYTLMENAMPVPTEIYFIANSYLNAPYLWGGKTLFGIDCSGLTQMVYRFLNYSLPRDAYQQAEDGQLIELQDAVVGDLAFFHNDKGKITHVGIILENDKIIHAHGKVRIDQLDKTGIYNTDKKTYSHALSFVKSYL